MKIEVGKYRHYKGQIYEVVGTATYSETLEQVVVYKATYQPQGDNLWVRPLAMFLETIQIDGKSMQRFTKI